MRLKVLSFYANFRLHPFCLEVDGAYFECNLDVLRSNDELWMDMLALDYEKGWLENAQYKIISNILLKHRREIAWDSFYAVHLPISLIIEWRVNSWLSIFWKLLIFQPEEENVIWELE